MTKLISFIVILFPLLLPSCKQSSEYNLIIDPTIKSDVNKHIETFGNSPLDETILIYSNEISGEFYEDDELILATNDKQKKIFLNHFIYGKTTL